MKFREYITESPINKNVLNKEQELAVSKYNDSNDVQSYEVNNYDVTNKSYKITYIDSKGKKGSYVVTAKGKIE